ncbi:CDP-glycerol glycerophosphotransferase family protein [Aeromicrobium sp. P5_D10]
MIFVAAVVLLAGLATAPLALAGAKARPPLAAHIPGQPTWVSPAPPFRFRIWVIVAAIATLVTIALMLFAPEFQVAAAFLSAAALGMISAVLRRYATGCKEVRAAVEAFQPKIAMPYAGKVGVHIGMWSPWIERTRIPWVIVARTPGLFRELAAMYPGTPIVQGKIPASVTAAFYSHGAKSNTDLIDGSTATHVFLGHGDSDKPLSASERVLQYDLIAVAGQAAIDRFAAAGLDVPADKIRIIGRPQTEGIRPAAKRVRKNPTVLYAPTWRHADDTLNVSSLAVADRIVQALLDRGCNVIFRRHFAGQNHVEAEAMIVRVNELLESAPGSHMWGAEAMQQPLIEAFNAADLMVSDVSGIVVDFMASNKPLVMYAAQYVDPADFRTSHPSARAAYVIDRDLVQLDSVLTAALGKDPLAGVRAQQADLYLGGTERTEPARRFMNLVEELGHTQS